MSLLVVLLVLIIVSLVWTSRNLVVIEPFTRQFFNQIKKTYFFGIDQSQLFGNEFELIQTIKRFVPFNLNTLQVNQSTDRFNYLNENRFQLVLARSNELHQLLTQYPQIRVVCALYKVPVSVITTVMGITEFEQLRGSKITLNVGPKNSSDYQIALDLLNQYHLVVGEDLCLSFYDINQLMAHYGKDVHAVIVTQNHPDKTINRIVNQHLSRLVEIKRYNNGNLYHMNPEETSFYQTHPYYSKMIIEKDRLRLYYPNMVINEWTFDQKKNQKPIDLYQSRFINTIGVIYYLLSNVQTESDSITELLYNLKLNIHLINQLGFIDEALNSSSLLDFILPIPTHPGAVEFYHRSGMITNLSNPGCLLINGRCDHQQLREHHLEHNYGPTFDALFND